MQPEDPRAAIPGAVAGSPLLAAVQHGLQREVPLQAPLQQVTGFYNNGHFHESFSQRLINSIYT